MSFVAAPAWRLLTPAEQRSVRGLLAWVIVAALADAIGIGAIFPLAHVLFGGGLPAVAGVDRIVAGRSIATILALFAVFYVLKAVLSVWVTYRKQSFVFGLQARLSRDLLRAYLADDSGATAAMSPGRKLALAHTECQQIVLNVYQPLLVLIGELAVLGFTVAILLALAPLVTLALIAFCGVIVLAFEAATRGPVRRWGFGRKEADKRRFDILKTAIDSRIEVVGLGIEGEIEALYGGPNATAARCSARKSVVSELPKSVLELSFVLGFVVLVGTGLFENRADQLATVALLGAAALRLFPSVNRVLVQAQSFKFGRATLEALGDVLSGASERPAPAQRAPIAAAAPDDVRSLTYVPAGGGAPPLEFAAGDIVAICGPSGSGKSTFLASLVDPARGAAVRVNGESSLSEWRARGNRVGFVGQNPFLVPATLRQNVLLGHPAPPARTTLPDFLKDRDPGGLLGGDDDAALARAVDKSLISGGEAQRISLLRSLLRDPQILILDEPTSALNVEFRDGLMEFLVRTRRARIVLVATHDPLLMRHCNRRIDVDKGAVRERSVVP